MNRTKLPAGWDEKRVRAVIEHYDRQTEDEAIAELEAARARYETPEPLVSEVAEDVEGYDKNGK